MISVHKFRGSQTLVITLITSKFINISSCLRTTYLNLKIITQETMLKKILYKKEDILEKIGYLIPVGKTTLLHGRSGCGKTLSIIKYLIEHNEKPYFIDFDSNDEYTDMDIIHIDGYKLVDELAKNKNMINELSKKTIIIDTYVKADQTLIGKDIGDIHSFVDALTDRGSTVIVIAHTSYFSGKPAEPDVETVFANHVACRLHLHNEVKMTKTSIYLEVEKLRGTDSKMLKNWMRDIPV